MVNVQTFPDPAAAGPVPTPGGPLSYIHWGPAFAGAAVAAAISFVLMSFASAVGLMLASPSPTWRDTSVGLAILSGVWIIVVALGSFALGGYLAGRVRSTWAATDDEVEFRDGAHGLLVWALGVLLGAALLWASATALTAVSAASSAPRESAGASTFLAYELDRLFRSERRPEPISADVRGEAARILAKGLGRDLPAEDRGHLSRVIAAATGLQPADADRRVAQALTEARASASQARRSAVILGFSTAAALAAAAAAAWVAAGIGGRHRDSEFAPPLRLWGAVVRPV